jgi:hypothetical protein
VGVWRDKAGRDLRLSVTCLQLHLPPSHLSSWHSRPTAIRVVPPWGIVRF